MVAAEERYQLITTYCDTHSHTANGIAERCDILLDETNKLFSAEQKTDIKHIRNAIQRFLLLLETVRSFVVLRGWASMKSQEFPNTLAFWLHDLRAPLQLVVGYAQLQLEGDIGPLTDGQQEELEYIYKRGQSLLTATTELLNSLRRA